MRKAIELLLKQRLELPRWARVPPAAGGVTPDQQQLRMFVLSHMCGPWIGLLLSAFLLVLGFPADIRLIGFSALICLFWAYPAALAAGCGYRTLSLLSLQHLTFVILWASHGYGGLTSPFLLWLAIVPLLASLYAAPRWRLWLVLLGALALDTGLFAAFTAFVLSPPAIDSAAREWLALLSVLSASAYVSMMAVYFGRMLSSRNELATEVARRRATAAALDRRVTELRQMRAGRLDTLSRLVRQCQQPVEDMLASTQDQSQPGTDDSDQASDLANIEQAAMRLRELLESVEAFRASGAQALGADASLSGATA